MHNHMKYYHNLARTALTLLLALLTTAAAWADEKFIGTDITNATYSYPVYATYNYSVSQQIYTTTQLGSDPFNIMSIGFRNNNSTIVKRQVDIYMMETDKSSFSSTSDWVAVSADNLVFSGEVTFAAAGWNTIDLTSSFAYTGSKNVLLVVNDKTGEKMSASSFSAYCRYTKQLSNYQCLYKSNSTSYDPSNMTDNGTRSDRVNQLRLITGAAACDRPTSVATSNITAFSATVQWEGSGSAWNLQYKANTSTTWTEVNGLTSKSYTLEGLDPEATYQVRVQTVGNDGVSLWKGLTFTTAASSIATPTNLACTAYTSTSATLSWTENSGATAWQICLNNDQSSIYNAGTNPFTIDNLATETTYSAKVRSVSGNNYSAWSSPVSFMPTPYLYIGSATGTNEYLPANEGQKYSLSEQIYTLAELGTSPCTFTSVGFMTSTSGECTRSLDIYMVATDKTAFDGGTDWVPVSADDLVFSGDVMFSPNVWTTITFDVPYVHTGEHGFVLAYYDKTNSTVSNRYMYYYTASDYQSLYKYDSTPLGLSDLSSISGSRTNKKNQIRLMPGDYPTCLKPATIAVSNLTPHTGTVTWEDNGDEWNLQYKADGDVDWTVVNGLTQNSYNLSNLTADANYTVRVQKVCGPNEVSIWKVLTFTTPISCNAPTDLACTAVTGNTATLGWTANGETAWQICLDGNETNLIDANTNPFTLTGLTAETFHSVKMRAVGDGVSRWSDAITFETTDKVRIGSGTATDQSVPAPMNRSYSVAQQIYIASELGGVAKSIESIDFYNNSDNSVTRTIDIYLKHTTKAQFNNNTDWIGVTVDDLVFSGQVTFASKAWTCIPLDVPFEFNGTHHVVLTVDDNTGISSGSRNFYSFDEGYYQTLYYWDSNNGNPDPTDMSGCQAGMGTSRNQIRLLMNEPAVCPQPTAFTVNNIGAHKVSLSWTERGQATKWQLSLNDDETNLIEINKNVYTLTGLSPETNYTVKVRSVSNGNYSRWAGPVSFTTTANQAPSYLLVNNTSPYSTELSWWNRGDGTAWKIAYKTAADADFTEIDADSNPFTITGLTPQTEYTVKVREVIEGETCPWSTTLNFTTLETNPVPFDVAAYPQHTAATVTWTGFSESYNVRYKTADATDWQPSIAVTEATATLTNLTAATDYVCQVQGITGEAASDWSAVTEFTTVAASTKVFITAGNWNESANWEPSGVPTATDDVIIAAPAVIPAGYLATARNITIEGDEYGGGGSMARMVQSLSSPLGDGVKRSTATSTPSITIKDGGQLRHATDDLLVTVEKNITGYGTSTTGGYLLLGLPLNDFLWSANVEGMTSGDYDLYHFINATVQGWENYKVTNFTFFPNNESAYLYANSANKTLAFTGRTDANNESGFTSGVYVDAAKAVTPFTNGWRIFANNSVCNAYVQYEDGENNTLTANFYKMNAAGNGLSLYKNYVIVNPGEAIFVEVSASGHLRCSYEPLHDAPTAEAGTYWLPLLPQHGQTIDHVLLIDAAANSSAITALSGQTVNVVLANRTLYKDGNWNTLCLPFSIDDMDINDTPLAGAKLMSLANVNSDTGFDSSTGTLTLDFVDAGEIEAGVAYIVKWETTGDPIQNPVFKGVTITTDTPADHKTTSQDEKVSFVGTYDQKNYTDEDKSVLFLGDGNTLYYPSGSNPTTIGAFRAYFQLNGITASESSSGVRAFNLNFGDETTGIVSIENGKLKIEAGAWYSLDGRKLDGKPTRKGLYIHNGKAVVIK